MENYYLQIIFPDVGTPPNAAGWNSFSELEFISAPWEVGGQISAPKNTFISLGKHKVKLSYSAVIYTSSNNFRSSWIDNTPCGTKYLLTANEWNTSVASFGWASRGAERQRKWRPKLTCELPPTGVFVSRGIFFLYRTRKPEIKPKRKNQQLK